MLWTILTGFLVTVIVLGCYSRSKFRTRNYRVSLWHYWMASAETLTHGPCVPSESHNGTVSPNEDVMEVETKKNEESENLVTQEVISNDTPKTETETNHGESEGAKTTPESTETPQDATTPETQTEHDTPVSPPDKEPPVTPTDKEPLVTPQDNGTLVTTQDNGTLVTTQDNGTLVTTQDNGTLVTTQDKEEPMSTTANESGAQKDPNEVTEKPTDSKNSSESSGEWENVESRKRPKKDAKKEEKATKKEEKGAQNDPNEVTEKPTDSKNSSESSGEWENVESRKRPKKDAKKEEKAAKKEEKATKKEEKDAQISPHDKGLHKTKAGLQKGWEKFVSSLSKELQQMMGGYWATEDTERYLEGYPNAKDHKDYNLNLEFYQNLLPSSPSGDLVESIHKEWFGAYDHLEQHHGYIQWLFPIQEQGLNHMAQPLQKHEIELLEKDDEAMKRLIKSYELMLDFFGMKLVDKVTGEIGRSDKSQKLQYRLLDHSFHNYLRITRILKCLGEFRFEHYQEPFCTFVISEIFEHGELKNTLKSCISYWGKVIKNFESRKVFYTTVDGYVKSDLAKKGSVVKKELHKYF